MWRSEPAPTQTRPPRAASGRQGRLERGAGTARHRRRRTPSPLERAAAARCAPTSAPAAGATFSGSSAARARHEHEDRIAVAEDEERLDDLVEPAADRARGVVGARRCRLAAPAGAPRPATRRGSARHARDGLGQSRSSLAVSVDSRSVISLTSKNPGSERSSSASSGESGVSTVSDHQRVVRRGGSRDRHGRDVHAGVAEQRADAADPPRLIPVDR